MPNIVSQIVEVTVFRKSEAGPQFLVLKRSAKDKLYPGIWQIVTGVIETGEKAVHAALREVSEETGLSPVKFWRLPFVNSFFDANQDLVHMCPNFAVLADPQAAPRLSKEHDSCLWCPPDEALRLLPWSGQRRAVDTVIDRFVTETEESRLLELPISS